MPKIKRRGSGKMKYIEAPDLQAIAMDLAKHIFPHLRMDRVRCLRSEGSSSRRTIARCHALGKFMQSAMGVDPFYAVEFISENFDDLSDEEKIKTIIHELMHIPKSFGGGFRHHDYVCEKNINVLYEKYKQILRMNRSGEISSFHSKENVNGYERDRLVIGSFVSEENASGDSKSRISDDLDDFMEVRSRAINNPVGSTVPKLRDNSGDKPKVKRQFRWF